MRVLHIITGLASGGAEQQLRMMLRRQECASEVAVLTNPGSVATAIRADGTVVHEIGMRGNRDATALARLVRLLRRGDYDLVHTHLYRACVYGRVAARLAGVPVLATEHSLGDRLIEGRPKSAAVRGLYLATERLGRTTIAVSRTVARRLVDWGVPQRRVVVVPNGVDAASMRYQPLLRQRFRAAHGLPAEAFTVGAVGRLVPTKRFDVAIRAVAGVAGAWLVVVGDGPGRAELARLAREWGVADRVVFTGESRDVAGALSAVDALVAPSIEETFGLTVLEGLAAGVPVLYSACPALEELPVGAAPGAQRLPSDPQAYGAALRVSSGGPRVRLAPPPAVTHYDITRLAAEVQEVYRGVLRHRQLRATLRAEKNPS